MAFYGCVNCGNRMEAVRVERTIAPGGQPTNPKEIRQVRVVPAFVFCTCEPSRQMGRFDTEAQFTNAHPPTG